MASDRVVAVSGAVAASLAPRDRVPSPLARKLQVIPNGVDVEATEEAARGWEAVRGQLGIPPTRHLLVAPANIRFAKGQDVLFRALALLPDMDFALLLAGQEERIGRRWRGLANRLGVANRVHWLGFRSDLPRLLRAADVVVMASRREGLPLALLEALVLGALPVVTDVGEMGTIVRETRGWVVPPGEPNAFAHALRQAMVGRERHRELSNRGASLVRERYSSTTMVAAYLRCYSEMAATLRDTNTS
jgi:starch synthase (maltosyl-transferring)